MVDRATIFEGVQVGAESTVAPGTPVAANRKLQSLSIDMGPQFDSQQFKPAGTKYTTIVVPNREWTEADISGVPTYDEVIWPLGSVVNRATPTTPSGATNARQWKFSSNSSGPDTPLTMTVEQGSSLRAAAMSNGVINSLELNISRSGIELSGSMIAQLMRDGITMTSSPTSFPLIPILPSKVDVYLDAVQADLGKTKLLRSFNVTWSLGDRFGQIWPLNSAKPSYDGIVETEPSLEVGLQLEADAVGMALLPTMRKGEERWLRVEVVGDDIDTVGSPVSITSSTNATPVVVTSASHGFVNGDRVRIAGHLVNTDANGDWWVANATTNTFELGSSVGNGVGVATGTIQKVIPYLFRLDQAIKLADTDGFDDADGVRVFSWSATGSHNQAYGKSYEFTVVNTQTSY